MKNSSDTIGNRTRDLPACSVVPQPTAPPSSHNLYVRVRTSRTSDSPGAKFSKFDTMARYICVLSVEIIWCHPSDH